MSVLPPDSYLLSFLPINHSEWWKENGKYLKFRRQGIDLIGIKFEQKSGLARANVILLTGWSECFLKYVEMIKMLFERGFNVYTYDHQSQGLSGRWLAEKQSTWIHTFDDYVDDFTFFITTFPKANLPLFAIAASMGGLICSVAMSKLPNLINRAVLLSPMLRNKCGMKYFNYQFPLPQPLTYWIQSLACYFGFGRSHALGYFKESPDDLLKLNITTSSQEQLNLWHKLRQFYPSIISCCVTNNWVLQSLKAQNRFESRYKFVFTNTLVILAEKDYFVYNRAVSIFAQRAPACKVLFAPSSFHEVWAEKDSIRGSTLKAISDFFTQKQDDVMLVEPSTPLILYDHNAPTYSIAEATIRSTGILIATLGVLTGITMIFSDFTKKL